MAFSSALRRFLPGWDPSADGPGSSVLAVLGSGGLAKGDQMVEVVTYLAPHQMDATLADQVDSALKLTGTPVAPYEGGPRSLVEAGLPGQPGPLNYVIVPE